jgi:hypothetical protein
MLRRKVVEGKDLRFFVAFLTPSGTLDNAGALLRMTGM